MTLMSIESSKEEVLEKLRQLYASRPDRWSPVSPEAGIIFELLKQKIPDTFEDNFWALYNIIEIFEGKAVSSRVRYFLEKTIASCEKINQAQKVLPFCTEKYGVWLLEKIAKLDCNNKELSLFLEEYCKKFKK